MIAPALGPDERVIELIGDNESSWPTPFYLYDLGIFTDRIEALRASLPSGSRLYYSMKANPHPAFVGLARSAGCALELASPGELSTAVQHGAPLHDDLVVGPAKSDPFLADCLAAGVGTIVLESLAELRRLDRIAVERAVDDVAVMLRLNLPGARGALRMSGHQFGMPYADAADCLATLEASRLRLRGFHAYLASQLLDVSEILSNTKLALDAAESLSRSASTRPLVDLGGGFGIPYLPTDKPLDLGALRSGLGLVLESRPFPPSHLSFESGRFLVGPAGALVCRVVDVKSVQETRFALLDGGTNSSGIFGGSNAGRALACDLIRDGRWVTEEGPPTNLCGPLCTPMDRLATGIRRDVREGDLVVWWNQGAYGLTAAPTSFLSFSPPIEIFEGQADV